VNPLVFFLASERSRRFEEAVSRLAGSLLRGRPEETPGIIGQGERPRYVDYAAAT